MIRPRVGAPSRISIGACLLLPLALLNEAGADTWSNATGSINPNNTSTKLGIGINSGWTYMGEIKSPDYQVLRLSTSNPNSNVTLSGSPVGAGNVFGINSYDVVNAAARDIAFGTGNPSLTGTGYTQGVGMERMRITGAGNVGIGNPSPQAKLDVDADLDESLTGSWGNAIKASAKRYPSIRFHAKTSNKTALIGNNDDGGMYFAVDGTGNNATGYKYALAMLPNGNVGIGNVNPASLNSRARVLEVSGANAGGNTHPSIVLRSGSAFSAMPAWEMLLSAGSAGNTTDFQLMSGTAGRLMVKGSNGNVGIGTSSDPQAKLDVDADLDESLTGSWGNAIKASAKRYPSIRFHAKTSNKTALIGNNDDGGMYFAVDGAGDNATGYKYALAMVPNGNVGVGNVNPASLNGRARVLEISGENAGGNTHPGIVLRSGSSYSAMPAWEMLLSAGAAAGTTDFQLTAGGASRIVVEGSSGNVGIGTVPNSGMKLHVAGAAKVDGSLQVASIKANSWTISTPDYVFEKDYKLASLDHVEKFVREKKHLPEIPSAHEMEKGGMDLAEMNLRLLKKVEELTLYAIAQGKTIKTQQGRMEEQAKRLSALERRLSGE